MAEQSREAARGVPRSAASAEAAWHTALPSDRLEPRRKNLTAAEARASMEEAQRLIDAIEPRTVANLRDRAIIGVMGYAWASVGAVLAMQVRDYYLLGDRGWGFA